MSKRKKRSGKRSRQSTDDLLRNGREAFAEGDYSGALNTWERAARQLPAAKQPRAAMAEAYFRRGVERSVASEEEGYLDLQRAVGRQPANRLYRYHLALAAQRLGLLGEAIEIYRELRQQADEVAERAAYPLALALSQQGQAITETEVWAALTPAQQQALQIGDLFNRRPYEVPEDAEPLWQGLAAFDEGNYDVARPALTQARAGPPAAQGIANFYLGAMAAVEEKWADAVVAWEAAGAAGFEPERLRNNLGEAYHRLAETRLEEGSVEDAHQSALAANRYKDDDNQLNQLLAHLYQHKAHAAVGQQKWNRAITNWESAERIDGGNFRLAYNIALALEKLEDYGEAAERWREAMRRRPRRDDHPDALTDEQVARLWQHTAEAYVRIGDYEEAARVYNTAVKWQPDNLTIRLARAESLLVDGRFEAAENEVERILKQDADYIPGLLLKGDLYSSYSNWYGDKIAVPAWERVLNLDPGNVEAEQRLVDYYLNRAEEALEWPGFWTKGSVIDAYQKALAYRPEDGRIEARLAQAYLFFGEEEAAETYREQALAHAPQDEQVYQYLIIGYMAVQDMERALALADRAQETIPDLPFTFNLNMASNCLYNQAWEMAEPWLARAEAQAPADVPVYLLIAEMSMTVAGAEMVARTYLEKALAADQQPGHAHALWGILEARDGEMKEARRHWQQAERLARETEDEELLERVEKIQTFFSDSSNFFRAPFGGDVYIDDDFFFEDDDLYFEDDDLFLDEDDDDFFGD